MPKVYSYVLIRGGDETGGITLSLDFKGQKVSLKIEATVWYKSNPIARATVVK